MSSFSSFMMYDIVHHFYEAALKCCLLSGFRHVLLGRSVQIPGCPGGRARLRLHILLEVIKMSIDNMDFERRPAAPCAVVLHQGTSLHVLLGSVIGQEAPNHCHKAGSSLLPPSQ